jgi:hypothetical protein
VDAAYHADGEYMGHELFDATQLSPAELDELELDDVRMVDTTDYSNPTVPDLHPDQCAQSGHEPARLVKTNIQYGTGQEASRVYECPCSSYQQVFFPNGSSNPKLPTQS